MGNMQIEARNFRKTYGDFVAVDGISFEVRQGEIFGLLGPNGCGDLHLTARDMARFGLLYLNDGEYEGNQIIPADWVHDSLQTYSEDAWDNIGHFRDIGYGYQWWSARAGDQHVNFAWGHGGQLIVLVDDLDMVVITTADPFWLQHDDQSWKHEKATISLVADFIASLLGE